MYTFVCGEVRRKKIFYNRWMNNNDIIIIMDIIIIKNIFNGKAKYKGVYFFCMGDQEGPQWKM